MKWNPQVQESLFWTEAAQLCLTRSWLAPLFPYKAGPLSSCCCRREAQRTVVCLPSSPRAGLGHPTGWLSPCRGTKEMSYGLGKEFDIYYSPPPPKKLQSNHHGENPLILILQFNGIIKNWGEDIIIFQGPRNPYFNDSTMHICLPCIYLFLVFYLFIFR